MLPQREIIGGLGNLMFKEAFLYTLLREGVIPDLYLQDERFFGLYAKEIKARFGSGIGKIDKVAIHVRRGDYVDNPFYVDLFKEGYYERAMKEFPNKEFLVFSDDLEWCKKQELFKECSFSSPENDEVDDMNAIASCSQGVIGANSSFSWWAAYLNPHGCKIVFPKAWFTDNVERTKLLDSWVKV